MSDTDKDKDQGKGDAVLRRMLKTPPQPHVKKPETESAQEQEPDGKPDKNRRPAKRS